MPVALEILARYLGELRRDLDADDARKRIVSSLIDDAALAGAEVDEDVVLIHLRARESAPEIRPSRGLVPDAVGMEMLDGRHVSRGVEPALEEQVAESLAGLPTDAGQPVLKTRKLLGNRVPELRRP